MCHASNEKIEYRDSLSVLSHKLSEVLAQYLCNLKIEHKQR